MEKEAHCGIGQIVRKKKDLKLAKLAEILMGDI